MDSKPLNNKIWIDLDNSPHVPLFDPIISNLENSNIKVYLTARDCAQTCQLADLFNLKYQRIGRHYGKNKILKVIGTIYRSLQLLRKAYAEKPVLAVSHGSRAQMLASWLLRIPTVVIMDYEHVKGFLNPTWIVMPEVIKTENDDKNSKKIIKYPGIKEDVYVPNFKPNKQILQDLELSDQDTIVTLRPPATDAHYHNPESEELFQESINYLSKNEKMRIVVLPRNEEQKKYILLNWAKLCRDKTLIIPGKVIDGLNLLWHSDFAISGGGTMNREAAALNVPVYSIFRGKIGAVDRYLASQNRMVLIESVDDIRKKINIKKREKSYNGFKYDGKGSALEAIVNNIKNIVNYGDKNATH